MLYTIVYEHPVRQRHLYDGLYENPELKDIHNLHLALNRPTTQQRRILSSCCFVILGRKNGQKNVVLSAEATI
jgi:hypothetical protein